MRLSGRVLCFGASLTALAPAAAAQTANVDLELVLAVDVSRSMDLDEQRLQREGYVEALRHPEVIDAIASGGLGRIAITYVEWAGPGYHSVIVPWTIIAGRAEAEAVSAKIAAAPLMRETGTSISSSLLFAAGLFEQEFASGMRQAIDISGDGPNNMGIPVLQSRDWVLRQGITINGLPIILKNTFSYGPYGIPNLDVYYEDCVIGGPGAFVITVDEPGEFKEAIRRKLVLEIAGLPPRLIQAAETPKAAPRVDCMIGEKSRRDWMWNQR